MAKKKPKAPALDLRTLGRQPGLPALTVARGASMAEAAAVCLEENNHAQGVTLRVDGDQEQRFQLKWDATTAQVRRTHNDLQDATADGACAVAILVACELTGMTVIERSRKGTGFDYWLGSEPGVLFQEKFRLEVSGILRGEESDVRDRVREKSVQTQRSDKMRIPAYVCVVEFSRPLARFVRR